jgi:hypothetical protein
LHFFKKIFNYVNQLREGRFPAFPTLSGTFSRTFVRIIVNEHMFAPKAKNKRPARVFSLPDAAVLTV